jgi:hypothetical protein
VCQRYFSRLLVGSMSTLVLYINPSLIGKALGLTRTNIWISHTVHCEVWWWNFYTAFTHFSRSWARSVPSNPDAHPLGRAQIAHTVPPCFIKQGKLANK